MPAQIRECLLFVINDRRLCPDNVGEDNLYGLVRRRIESYIAVVCHRYLPGRRAARFFGAFVNARRRNISPAKLCCLLVFVTALLTGVNLTERA